MKGVDKGVSKKDSTAKFVAIHRRIDQCLPMETAEWAKLEQLLEALELGSLCAHGGGMPAPIRSLLAHFPEELGLAT